MSSSDQVDASTVDPRMDFESLPNPDILPDSNSMDIMKPMEVDGPSVDRDQYVPGTKISSGTEEITPVSPIHSPKSGLAKSQSDTSIDGTDVTGDPLESAFATQSDALCSQEEVIEAVSALEDGSRDIEDALPVSHTENTLEAAENEEDKAIQPDDSVLQKQDSIAAAASLLPDPASNVDNPTETETDKTNADHYSSAEQSREADADENVTTNVNGTASMEDTKEAGAEPSTPSQPTRSIPPHLRPDFQPRQYGLGSSRHMPPPSDPSCSTNTIRAFRPQYPLYHSPPQRHDYSDSEALARTRAQLMKIQNELNAARKSLASLRSTITAEQHQKIESAFSSLLSSLLEKQAEALAAKTAFEAKQRDLAHRERMITQLEIYLAEGQKQVKYQLEEQGIRTMDEVDSELIKRKAQLMASKSFADSEVKLALQVEKVKLREGVQGMREDGYKILVREEVEAEASKNAVSEEKVGEIIKEEFGRGFEAGKEEGRKDGVEQAQQEAFMRGYAACRRVQTALHDLRAGRIAGDSPELEFLFDAGHVENLFNRGVQIGKLEGGHGVHKGEEKTVNGHAMKDHSVGGEEMVDKHARSHTPEPTLPPRPTTLAAQLRAATQPQPQALHNGHFILANSAASGPSLTPTPTSTAAVVPIPTVKLNGVNGAHGVNGANGTNGINGVNGMNSINGLKPTNGTNSTTPIQPLPSPPSNLRYEDTAALSPENLIDLD